MGFVNILIINRLFQSFCVKKKSRESCMMRPHSQKQLKSEKWFLPTHDKSYNNPGEFILSRQSRSIINPHK